MGQFAMRTGMSAALFRAASDWFGHLRGLRSDLRLIARDRLDNGLVGQPEMCAAFRQPLEGVLVAGSTLGILIPPSAILMIYALLAQQNTVRMLIAALLPEIPAALGYALTVALCVRLRHGSAPTPLRVPVRARFAPMARIWLPFTLLPLVIGGLVSDWYLSRPGRRRAPHPHRDLRRGRGGAL